MRSASRFFSMLLLAAAVAAPIASTGCEVHAYRVHDPYYNDDHHWNHGEEVYYQQWEVQTHRDHQDFRKRDSDDQKQYWEWRHSHHDNDRH